MRMESVVRLGMNVFREEQIEDQSEILSMNGIVSVNEIELHQNRVISVNPMLRGMEKGVSVILDIMKHQNDVRK